MCILNQREQFTGNCYLSKYILAEISLFFPHVANCFDNIIYIYIYINSRHPLFPPHIVSDIRDAPFDISRGGGGARKKLKKIVCRRKSQKKKVC